MAEQTFDIDNPDLPEWVDDRAFQSGGFPYERKLDRKEYEERLEALQIELVKLQSHLQASGERVALVFEGRDAAGKGGSIKRYLAYLNARHNRIVALSKPSETERGQWYFQRYAATLPTAGEQVLFDRSWYNRAVVEPVMGFCTPEQTEQFLEEAPHFEHMLARDGIRLFKFWLAIGREMQLKRFHDRRHDPLRVWKLSPVDLKAMDLWDDFTARRDDMLRLTHTDWAPWSVVRANDKRRARVNIIAKVLSQLDYPGRDNNLVEEIDDKIVLSAPDFAAGRHAQE